jgi:hypothetical protein
VMRSTWPIRKARSTLRQIPLQPLVPVATTDAKASAQLSLIRARDQCQLHELLSQFHRRKLPPRHPGLLLSSDRQCRTSVLDVSERVSWSVLDVPSPYTTGGRVALRQFFADSQSDSARANC